MPVYQAIPAETKYAKGPRPLCDCHRRPMNWHADTRLKAGGWWRCAVKVREQSQRWEDAHWAPRYFAASRRRLEKSIERDVKLLADLSVEFADVLKDLGMSQADIDEMVRRVAA